MTCFLQNAKVITSGKILENAGVLVENGKIVSLSGQCPRGVKAFDLEGNYLAPTFIDLHCHGGAGFEFIDGTEEAVLSACRIHAEHGTGVLYPTLSASRYQEMYRALEVLEKVREKAPLLISGVHLEGPYLSPEMCGAQDPDIIRKPDPKEYRALYDRFGSLIARWDYAPETDEDGAFLSFLTEKGIVPATAHSAAQYRHMLPALKGGNRLVTHLYSCTSTVVREGGFRKLGIIETAFLFDDIFVEAIGDGCHLPPELVGLIYKIKGPERMCLITDAIRYAGCSQEDIDSFESGHSKVPYLIEDGVAKLRDRSAFAGSIATTDVLLRKGVEAGIPLAETVRMLTETPAHVMGLSSLGSIAPGFDARFTAFDTDLNVLPLNLD